ncbi:MULTISPECIES: SDR family NAD(P)-dependent oxidoreductase [Actinomadura]|uniref:SDR family oxidoreductase n=1 Tax=Actinomadura litoris TaxID=2678616 RepID=A0A7K1KVL5_9ACTN|nr:MULTISPECIES: SDR family oxidoreductase [Actinomadura]MBT2211075.1 SDR family oxidoreductase [Actinomadura sp. NEAU-AAG7]MUN35996.1 SDR family oxidoreductase [Actinomadura litoris]
MTMRGLSGKNVLISGGTSGIGEAAARRFLEEGARVFVCGLDRVEDVVAALSPLGKISGTTCDVSHEDDVERLVAEATAALGGVDVLINNAGTGWREPFLEITPEHWDTIMAVNLRGMFLVGQAVSRLMVRAGTRGSIVNMSSTNGLGGEEDYAHYNASKGGVLLLTKTMAVELGRHGIRVNAVCPGYISTPLNAGIEADLGPDFVAAYQRDHIPLGRAGQAAEVAAAYAFLASDDASFVHGAELVIDGGQLAIM